MSRRRHATPNVVALDDDEAGRKFYAVQLGASGILVIIGGESRSYELDGDDIDALGAMLDEWRKHRGASPRGVKIDPEREAP